MGLIQNIKNLFGGLKMSDQGNGLGLITDDPRIKLPPMELTRIQVAFQYYRNDFGQLDFYNTYNQHKKRPISYLAVTKNASRQLASLMVNEGFEVSVQADTDDDSQAINDLITDVFSRNNFLQTYEENLELGIATGGFAIRPYVQNNHIKMAWIRADQFVPLESNTNEIQSAVIVSKTSRTENGAVAYYSLLEFHNYNSDNNQEVITNELYRSNSGSAIGSQVNLSTLEQYQDLPETVTLNGISRPTFAYFKTPGKNNINVDSPLGIGLVDNNIKLIDAINIANDQFVREVKLGRRRIGVSAELIKPQMNQRPQNGELPNQGYPMFAEDDDVFMQLANSRDDKTYLQDMTTDIRVQDYSQTLEMYMHEFENAIGMSQGSLSVGTNAQEQTATEVVSDNSKTYRTRSSYLTQVEKQLRGLITTIVELASIPELFDDEQAPLNYDVIANPLDININFEDGVFVDKDTQAKNDILSVQNGLMPKVEYLKRNYGLSEQEAQVWLDEIQAETPDPVQPPQENMMDGGD